MDQDRLRNGQYHSADQVVIVKTLGGLSALILS
jgi:hypothetical protein